MLDNGTKISDLDFKPPQVHLEEVLLELSKYHLVLCSTLEKIVDFMQYEVVRLEENENAYVLPDESNYRRLIFSTNI